MLKRYCAVLSYDGTSYCGFQRQINALTIQEVLESAFSTLFGERVSIVGCGRTDSGVHAKSFYCHFDTNYPDPQSRIHNLNGVIGEQICIYSIFSVSNDFHARFDAISRSYEYHLHLNKDPFIRGGSFYFYNAKGGMDLELLNHCADILKSYSDFKSFCKSKSDVKTTECLVSESRWERNQHRIIYYITANRFLRGMVRLIVGAMLNVGTGKMLVHDFENNIKNRRSMSPNWSVPPHGLYLSRIEYPKSMIAPDQNKVGAFP